jgi:hypothetical protein
MPFFLHDLEILNDLLIVRRKNEHMSIYSYTMPGLPLIPAAANNIDENGLFQEKSCFFPDS